MTNRELVIKTLEFKNKTGKVPVDISFLPWIWHNDPENAKKVLEKYDWCMSGVNVVYKEKSSVAKGDLCELGDSIDEWGCKFHNILRGVLGEVKEPIVCDDEWNDLSRVVFPNELFSFDIEQVNKVCAETEKFVFSPCYVRPFERLQFIRGTENLFVDLMTRPKNMMSFIEEMHDFNCRLLEKWAQTDVDGLMIMDDWGTQKSLLINPKLWEEMFKPMYKDYIDIAHKYNKKAFMHSDGYILDIIPHLIELGLDAINCQIFCMGIENLEKFKGKITFWGEMDRQNILPYATPQKVKDEVIKIYKTLWDNGGLVGQCEFGNGAKAENIYALYDTWTSF